MKLDLLFAQSIEDERQRFEKYRQLILTIAEVLSLDVAVFRNAEVFERTLNLTTQDAIVYASVLSHLRSNQPTVSCFLNRNSKDFDIPEIRTELEELGCTMIPSFDDGLRFISGRLNN